MTAQHSNSAHLMQCYSHIVGDTLDCHTRKHCQRVAMFAHKFGIFLNLSKELNDRLYAAALVHDIGKHAISADILGKTSVLTARDRMIVKTHSILGYQFLTSNYALEEAIAETVLQHHERYDGAGYPLGLAGKDILYLARIISVIDAFDAMTNLRVYREALSISQALEELLNEADRQFDPDLIRAFVWNYQKIVEIDFCPAFVFLSPCSSHRAIEVAQQCSG